jgi:hypothetical protein
MPPALVIWEIQIKTIMRYHFTSFKMTIIMFLIRRIIIIKFEDYMKKLKFLYIG